MEQNIFPMSERYQEYLIDESKYSGSAESISFPESEEMVLQILQEMKKAEIPVTIQGGKTGITGGSVPQGGHILNLSHMNQVKEHQVCADGTGRIAVEPGVNLIELEKEITVRFRKEHLFWPVDPTETSATVGGIAAAGAQGITRLLYGDSRKYIEKIRAIDGNGRRLELTGEEKEDFLGKEGITGIITELTLILLPCPEERWGILFFFEEEAGALQFIEGLKGASRESESGNAKIASVEYLDRQVLTLIEERKHTMNKIRELPDVEEFVSGAVYVEIHGAEDGIEEIAEYLMEQAAENGSDPDTAWAVSGDTEIQKLHAFRHAAAESCNLFIEEAHRKDDRITKLGTDMYAEGQELEELVSGYRRQMEEKNIKGCIFGHALENHLHINLLPENYEEYEAGMELFRSWAEETVRKQGKPFGEHGVGKLKSRILAGCQEEEYREQGEKLKAVYDPERLINRGNRYM